MTQLKELAKLNGFTQKQLSDEAKIKYTTLVSMSNRSFDQWNDVFKIQVADALKMSLDELQQSIDGKVLSPFIKWVGGKRQLLPELLKYLPKNGFNTYYEPFIGGGALFLRLAPKRAVINDLNNELIATWSAVQSDLHTIKNLLLQHQIQDSKEYYLQVRSADRDGRILRMSEAERGARFIYMNKAGYNGLWRENSKGQNNVPYGTHKPLKLVTSSLDSVSRYLNSAKSLKMLNGDYQCAVDSAETGDFVYFDPPYIPVTPSASFTSYTKNGFGMIQQEQLRDVALKLAKRGVKVMLSNSDVSLIDELYCDPIFKVHRTQARRSINSNASKRGNVGEVIITTY